MVRSAFSASASALVSAIISGLRCSISLARTATPMNSKEPPRWLLASSRSMPFISTRAPARCTRVSAGSCTRPTSTCPWRSASRRLTPMVANWTLRGVGAGLLQQIEGQRVVGVAERVDADGLAFELLDRLDLCRPSSARWRWRTAAAARSRRSGGCRRRHWHRPGWRRRARSRRSRRRRRPAPASRRCRRGYRRTARPARAFLKMPAERATS